MRFLNIGVVVVVPLTDAISGVMGDLFFFGFKQFVSMLVAALGKKVDPQLIGSHRLMQTIY